MLKIASGLSSAHVIRKCSLVYKDVSTYFLSPIADPPVMNLLHLTGKIQRNFGGGIS